MKSTPFMIQVKVPTDISEGDTHTDNEGIEFTITKIKSIKFLNTSTMQVWGMCK